jgi:hypothetical protein
MSKANSSGIAYEVWFVPVDIITNIGLLCGTLLVTLFFFVILFDKTCRNIPMLLVGNSCLAGIVFGALMFWMNLFKLLNDWAQIEYQDTFCNFRGYFGYSTCSIFNCSFLIQAAYRFVRVLYPSQLIYQSWKFQLSLIVLSWLFGILFPIGFMLNNEIHYNPANQICQLPLRFSLSIIYMAHCAYTIPVSLTMIIYILLVAYVKKMSKRVASNNRLSRAKQELKMVRRTVILVSILVIYCLPYAMFIFLSFFITIPKYQARISYIFIDPSYLFAIIALYKFTDPLKESIKRLFLEQKNRVLPALTTTTRM